MRTALAPLSLALFVGCAAQPSAETPAPPPPAAEPAPIMTTSSTEADDSAPAPAPARDLARGGRLYDKWYADESFAGDFAPGKEGTPGRGGPKGDGTLLSASGKPIPNTGHDYRMKNLFGWDLRGTEGVYGPDYQKKAVVLSHNLLTERRSEAEIAAWLKSGDEQVPAYGAVLSDDQIADVAAFIVAMRDRRVPHPDDVWQLSKTAPKGYVLNAGADVQAGIAHIKETCVDCHGENGTDLTIDAEYSVGAYARIKGYETWLKILNGHPGSSMGPQVPADADPRTKAKLILDVLAALCDRKAFPKVDEGKDVEAGDARCGSYLK